MKISEIQKLNTPKTYLTARNVNKTNNSLVYEKLSWDTDYFGYGVAKICIPFDLSDKDITTEMLIDTLAKCKKDHIKLVYVFINPESRVLNAFFSSIGFLADTKTTLSVKTPEKREQIDHHIKSVIGKKLTRKLKMLALEAGRLSRFAVDVNFKNNEFEKLYFEWIKNSLSGSNADEVFSYFTDERNLGGFITIHKEDSSLNIGLIAVDTNVRRQGIGSKLLKAVFNYAQQRDINTITVTTQLQNKTALDFYTRHGFIIRHKVNIFHIWNK